MRHMLALVCLAVLCLGNAQADTAAHVLKPQVQGSVPHDATLYTQGLLWHAGQLYESAGRYGQSSLSLRELSTGRALRNTPIPAEYFAEGLTLIGDELFQLTWKEFRLFVYDKTTLQLKRSQVYEWEGWGLTHDDRHLIASDGSDTLRFLDPKTLKVTRSLSVRDGEQSVPLLNELEYIEGEIYANVYGSDWIARIDPRSGRVLAWLDLSGLYPYAQRPASDAVLNGIAFDPQRRLLLVTGKLWPRLYLIPLPKPIKKPG